MLEQDQAVRSLEPNRAGNILLVDDDPGVLEVVRAMLESLGYAVVDWSDSLDAYIDLKSRPDFFDLVLTDFKMPGVDGLDLGRLISLSRYARSERPLPLILMTGSEVAESELHEAGFTGCLKKPFRMQELKAAIDAALGNGRRQIEIEIETGESDLRGQCA